MLYNICEGKYKKLLNNILAFSFEHNEKSTLKLRFFSVNIYYFIKFTFLVEIFSWKSIYDK